PALAGYERVQVGVFLFPPLPLLFPSPCPSPARGEGTQERPLHTNANRCNIFSLLWLCCPRRGEQGSMRKLCCGYHCVLAILDVDLNPPQLHVAFRRDNV